MSSQSFDKKYEKFRYRLQVHMCRTTHCLGAHTFKYYHNFVSTKGLYLDKISKGKTTTWEKDVYIRKMEYWYAAGKNIDLVVNISELMADTTHYIKRYIDTHTIDSQFKFTLVYYIVGVLGSYKKLSMHREIINFRYIIRFDGRLYHEVSPLLSGVGYLKIFSSYLIKEWSILHIFYAYTDMSLVIYP